MYAVQNPCEEGDFQLQLPMRMFFISHPGTGSWRILRFQASPGPP